MQTANDRRIWIDRVQGKEMFLPALTQKFYSVEYEGPNKEEIMAFTEKVEEFALWARDAFRASRAGDAPPPVPEYILPEQDEEPPKKEDPQRARPAAKAKEQLTSS